MSQSAIDSSIASAPTLWSRDRPRSRAERLLRYATSGEEDAGSECSREVIMTCRQHRIAQSSRKKARDHAPFQSANASAMTNWLWTPQPRPHAQMRLYCFASAGAGAGAFARWSAAAPEDLEITGIQLPGRETRLTETPLRNLAEIASLLAPILDRADGRRFALFGHSAGARLATHVLLRLSSARHRAVHLFVSGSRWTISRDEPFHKLDTETFFERIAARYGALPKELTADPAIRSLFERPLRADFEAAETDDLVPRPLQVPLTVISGSRDDLIDVTTFADWQAWSERPIAHEIIDADHFSYRTDPQPYLRVIARHLFPGRSAP